MTPEFWIFYAATIFVASIIPGPSMLLALTHGIKYGMRRTLATALGNTTASALQAIVSIAGLGAILTASETIFHVIKWAGAAYLIYLGLRLWFSPISQLAAAEGRHAANRAPLAKMFLEAFLVAAGNPKAIVFFTALFPQFINTQGAQLPQYILMVSTLALIAFLCMMIYAVGGHKITGWLSISKIGRHLNRVIGGTFIGLGVGLAVSRR